MKRTKPLKYLTLLTILFCFSCDSELEDCYETVCLGPDNTNCHEEPNYNSGCFPMETPVVE